MLFLFALSVASLAGISACDAYIGGLPTATGTVSSSAVIEVAAGETFDVGWKKYDRGSGACSDQSEGDYEDAVFYLHEGVTLHNVIIGANQAEGTVPVFRLYLTLNYVWFEDVCEDAITIKNDEVGDYTNIIGGDAYHAEDKVIQHNGCGTVNIINFFVSVGHSHPQNQNQPPEPGQITTTEVRCCTTHTTPPSPSWKKQCIERRDQVQEGGGSLSIGPATAS
ncbi:pectin lyase-like protein [Armillaria gallica]|uniref:Pectate lyase n=1 Tax=Armillaria gallica TaxID=47427 RepID=A0A2H3DMF2_ARMGA|nr:pectin lyase-like protein [Armillaria gallica]